MIERLISWCARNRILTLAGVLIAAGFGVYGMLHTPLDAIPDLSDTQVIVSTEWPGRSPDLVEDQITYPIVTALRAAPGVQYVRGLSMLGDSFVYVVFKDGVDLYCARSRVLEYLASIRGKLPEGVNPTLGPAATAVGRVIEVAEHENAVRGRGYIHSLADLESIPVKVSADGTPVTLRDLGQVHLGPEQRRGLAELNGQGEVVGGIVIMRQRQNALNVIEGLKRRLREVEASLPPGVRVVVTYDRSELIQRAVHTLWHELLQEMLIVSAVIVFFLFHFRSALIPILTLPIAVVLAFVPMARMGLTANIMSLGGIAVAIGAMVDASIIMVENVHKKLEAWEAGGRQGAREDAIVHALKEVGGPIFFALLVITVSFLPIFTLEATEGRLFKPLAFTKTFSMAFSALLAVTLTPALAAWFIRGRIRAESEHPVSRLLVHWYAPVVRFAVRRRRLVVFAAALLLLSTIPVFLRLGSEFMPPLNEGTLLYMPTAPPGMSDTEASSVLQQMDRRLRSVPEVETVFGKIGRARTATDPAPLSMVERSEERRVGKEGRSTWWTNREKQ